ncbi:invasion associated locus B family protein [Shinella sp.]|uniref:invasion associated locus B family protein n=1 Tax=Shinella sp. TaxID=1870904 RepID=UPI00301CEDC9
MLPAAAERFRDKGNAGLRLFSRRPRSEDPVARNVELAVQFASVYMAGHPVTVGHGLKIVDEVYNALSVYRPAVAPAPGRIARALALLGAGALGALVAAAGIWIAVINAEDMPGDASASLPLAKAAHSVPLPSEGAPDDATAEIASSVATPRVAAALGQFSGWQLRCEPNASCTLRQKAIAASSSDAASVSVGRRPQGAGADVAITLPFTVALDSRITLQTGAGALESTKSFDACTPEGCVVRFEFGEREVAELKRAALLQVNAASGDGRILAFPFSLQGFSAGYDALKASAQSTDQGSAQ